MTGPRLSIIPARAATDRALKPRDLQVLCVLGRHTDDFGWCRRSQVKMAAEMDCARSTVFEAIERLVKAGYLERHEQEHETGRDSAHIYRVILDPIHPAPQSVQDFDYASRAVSPPMAAGAPDGRPMPADARSGLRASPVSTDRDRGAESGPNPAAPPAGISAPPAGPEPAPPAGPGPAPINDPSLTTPVERSERERGREELSKKEQREAETTFWQLVKDWPGFAGMPKDRARAVWFALSPEDRLEAIAKFPHWLALLKAQRKTHVPAPSTYFGERLWRDVPEPEEKRPDVEGKPFGKLWSAMRMRILLATVPQAAPPPTSDFLRQLIAQDDAAGRIERLKRQATYGWPGVNRMHEGAANRRSIWVAPDESAHRLAQLMEPIRVGSAAWEAWRREHEQRGWPWLPDPGGAEWVYFPAGGPAGLQDFEAAANAAENEENHDPGRSEAAE